MSEAEETFRDVIVVGAGWSGLMACKYMLEERLTVVALEKRSDVGGLWYFTQDTGVVTVMTSTKTTSSSSVTEMSDFPMPIEIGDFPKHEDILRYLKAYCDAFELWPHICFDHGVEKASKEGDIWKVECENGRVFKSKFLVISTGCNQIPNRSLEETILKHYEGEIRHSSELKTFDPKHKGKRVMLIGGGETASDVVEEWCDHVDRLIWSIPRGMHFFRKLAKILPNRQPQALDKASSRMMKFIAPYTKSKPGLAWICKWTSMGSLLAYQGHGIAEWKNDAKFFHCVINKNGHVLDRIDYKHCIPKGAIETIQGKRVVFCDSTEEEVDVIIQCTGYKTEFPMLSAAVRATPITDNYKYIFNMKDPTLAFIGYVRPVLGSLITITEIQSFFVSRVFSGRCRLPLPDERQKEALNDKLFWEDYFKDTSRRLSTLVEAYTYGDDIGKKCGITPDYWALFKRNPRAAIMAVFAPYNGSSLRLSDTKYQERALQQLRNQSSGTFSPLHLLLISFLRLIWFDFWLDILGEVKYRIQCARWWRKIRDSSPIRFLDFVWQTPKRLLFDNTTRA
ncbi:dimethylaniline monooxygenase [N-oxide-forming] 2-like [Acropora muricata]|uniref:dimethylaniline monooxygenase [N-oxide-forming] 2-like n=1 Tax=Acropora muricata TaxID=159855 RepID=UPI0034E4E918